jgi:hypothetical protein
MVPIDYRWTRRLAEQEPIVVFSFGLGLLAVLMPVTVIPIRRRLGMDTSQYDGVPAPGAH